MLVIVSEPLAQRIIKRLLQRSAHWPLIVSSEADALDALENVMFDAMIIDTETLGLSSAELVKLVKMARLDGRALPVIALTNNEEGAVSRELKEVGIEAILTKPVPPRSLLDILLGIARNEVASPEH